MALVVGSEDVIAELQRERGLTAGLAGGDSTMRSPLEQERAAVDASLTRLSSMLASDPPGAGAVRTALGFVDQMPTVREQADAHTLSRADALSFYTQGITALTSAAFSGAQGNAVGDDQLQASLTTLRSLCDATEATALERGTLNGILAVGSFKGGDYPAFVRLAALRTAALGQVGRTASPAVNRSLAAALRTPDAVAVAGAEQTVLADYASSQLPLKDTDWWRVATGLVNALYGVQQVVEREASDRAGALRSTALQDLEADAALAALAVLGAAALGLFAARSITRPMARLVAQARSLADEALPSAVASVREASVDEDPATLVADVTLSASGPAELATVAEALSRVAGTAVRLAADEAAVRRNTAESLANLSRRNQDLVARQLRFLSALEHDEQDPGVLANLFDLDHLATRMRRNAESVLILTGEVSPRRFATPVPMGDVIRSALGEVEDYRRIDLQQIDTALLDGAAVAETAHLLAELIDNALAASPPDADVEVFARLTGSGYLVAVVDHGAGMDEEALRRANARLSGRESFLVGRSGRLGHYVVGRLASRLGAEVKLTPSPPRGVTASLFIPPELVVFSAGQAPTGLPGALSSAPATSAIA